MSIKTPWFSKVENIWGLISLVQVLKDGVPDVRFKHFTPQREALGFEFPPIVGCSAGDGIYRELVSQPLLPVSMWAFSQSPHV